MTGSRFLLAAAICLATGASTRALAADDRQRAAALLDEGLARLDAGDYAAAHDRFRRAYETFPSPKILLNLGEAARLLGRDVEAAESYETFLGQASSMPEITPEKVAKSRAGLAMVLRRIGRVRLDLSPPDAAVTVDDRPTDPAQRRGIVYVTAGTHRLSARAAGHLTKSVSVSISAGTEVPLALHLPRAARTGFSEERSEDSPAVLGRLRYTWIAAGGTALMATVGAIVGWHSSTLWREYRTTTRPERWDELRSQIQTEATIANVLFGGAAVAALTTGVVFYYEARASGRMAHRPTDQRGACVSARVSFGRGALGGQVRFTF